MVLNALISALHLLAMALAFAAIAGRGRELMQLFKGQDTLKRVLLMDNLWGVSALLLLPTGFYRLLVLEKGWAFYSKNPFFHAKMTFVVFVLLLEIAPMISLVKVRLAQRKGEATLDPKKARRFAIFSHVQSLLLVLALVSAAFMARGVGQF
jgi:putative membrane protein